MKNASKIRTAFYFTALIAAVLSGASPAIVRADSSVLLNGSYIHNELQNYLQNYYASLRAREELLRHAQTIRSAQFKYRRKVQRKYVNSPEDLFDHFASHIERAEEGGVELKHLHAERYKDVDVGLLRILMRRHDFAKLEKDARTGKRVILNRLYWLYGQDIDVLSEKEKKIAVEVRDVLNQKDAEHAMNFFKAYNHNDQFIKNGKLTALAEKYLEIERVADKVDRGFSPVSAEEFGREKMQLASVYIKDPTEKMLAESLEKSPGPGLPSPYERVTKGHSFEEFRQRKAKYAHFGYTCVLDGIIRGVLERDAILPQASVFEPTSHARH